MRRIIALALVLAACGRQSPDVVDEATRRAEYVRSLSEREGLLEAWSLTSRADLWFEDGMSNPTFIDDPAGDVVRWMDRTAHFRVRGTTDMVLELRGKLVTNKAFARPQLEISIAGAVVDSKLVDVDGSFAIRTVVKRATIGDWVDMTATFSSLPESAPVRLEWVGWTPASS